MSDISVEVLYQQLSLSVNVDLKNDHSLELSISSSKFPSKGQIYVTYENATQIYDDLFACWDFNADTTTQQFLAEYDTEALVEDLFKDCDMPHEEKLYIANTIIWACEKLENGEADNG